MRYRPDIDGLRAFAVMAVVLFHAGLDAVPGGFVGVDIFFVISGYLITGLIVEKLREGIDRYNETLHRVCDELSVDCVDLTSMSGREECFFDDAHFTESGAAELARRVAQAFLEKGILNSRRSTGDQSLWR